MNKYIFSLYICLAICVVGVFAHSSEDDYYDDDDDSSNGMEKKPWHNDPFWIKWNEKLRKKHQKKYDPLDDVILGPEINKGNPVCTYCRTKKEHHKYKKNYDKWIKCLKIAQYLRLMDKSDWQCSDKINYEYRAKSVETSWETVEVKAPESDECVYDNLYDYHCDTCEHEYDYDKK